ncbi:hypothetical protein FSP39_004799 [Pinctada imbricata]|uniref:PH domain-containing protein n=1 Tax=Pinctada imbricata TaxID=66713 RepID=A0AA88XYV7_PINIB|nr:hypothetical protein FSP39_004799 [Pinctada imbricata]
MDNVIKQGYLKKAHPAPPCQTSVNLATSIKQLFEPQRWYVFGMKQGSPILEYYEKEESVFTSQPLQTIDLSTCERITYTLGRNQKHWTFCLFMQDRVLELSADTREHMLSWCRLMERSLHEHGRLRKPDSDHVYSEYPMKAPIKKNRTPSPPSTQAPPPPLPPDRRNTRRITSSGAPVTTAATETNPSSAAAANVTSASSVHVSSADQVSASGSGQRGSMDEIFSDQASVIYNFRKSLVIPKKGKTNLKEYEGMSLEDSGAASARPTVVADPDSSSDEPETTGEDDFLEKEFWLSHKLEKPPPVPLRVDSMKGSLPGRNTASYSERRRSKDDLTQFRMSIPPLPTNNRRPQSMIINLPSSYDNNEEEKRTIPLSSEPQPKPSPRKINQRKEGAKEASQISRDNMYSFVRRPKEPIAKKYSSESERLPSSSDSEAGDESDDEESEGERNRNTLIDLCNTNEDQRDYEDYDDATVLKEEYAIYDLANTEESKEEYVKKFADLDDGYQAITEVKNSEVNRSVGNRTSVNEEGEDPADYYCTADLRVTLPKPDEITDRNSSELTPTNPSGYDYPPSPKSINPEIDGNDYAPFPGQKTNGSARSSYNDDPIDTIPQIPSRNSKSSVQGYTENIPEKPPRKKKVSSPSNTQRPRVNTPPSSSNRPRTNTPPSSSSRPMSDMTPLKIPQLPENSTKNVSRAKSDSDYKIPPRKRNVPPLTEYAYVTRDEVKPSKKVPPQRPPNRPQLPKKQLLIPQNLTTNGDSLPGRNSPSLDNFQFNVGRSKDYSSEDDEEDAHAYEDATMLHDMPPEPPPRNSRKFMKSISVHAPLKKLPERDVRESLDDMATGRPKNCIYRQPSLGERQRVSQVDGSINVTPLKQSQVEILKQQQKLPGIQLNIHAHNGARIAFVDINNAVWVAGWDMRACPRLSDKLHIGDRVIQINQIDVSNTIMAHKVIKHSNQDMMELVVKRLPLAKVFSITRTLNRQPLGIKREGGTAEISYVDPNGLAYGHGLQQKMANLDGSGDCHWWITEINSRPINLFFKAGEMEPLLNPVGKDISLVVLPVPFITELKKQMKKLKNYKDFLAL